MLKGKKCPRAGLRVKADPNPVSMALYSPGHAPTPGATGTVTKLGRSTCMPGPGGGLVYVDWDDGRTFGVSRYDIAKTKGKAVVMQASPAVYGLGAVGHGPLHNETVLKNYGKCLRKCKRKPHVGPCIDACLREQPAPGHEALAGVGVAPNADAAHIERLKAWLKDAEEEIALFEQGNFAWEQKYGTKFPGGTYAQTMRAQRDHFRRELAKRGVMLGAIPGRYDFTEADEGATDKKTALANLREKLLQYARGIETMGVLTMYENAARRAGATSEEIQEQRAMVQRTLHSVDGLGGKNSKFFDDHFEFITVGDEPTEPDEDDITTSDHKHWYQSGKLYFTGDEGGLQAKMAKDNFWPNVWFISDHGNAHLIVLR